MSENASNDPAAPRRLERADGHTIAYHATAGARPGIVFLGGFMSDMTGTKAMALEAFCRTRGRAFLRFDYLGHGASSGDFEDGTIGRWADDAIAVIDAATEGPLVLVGSSMGGWIMLLTALARPERVKGLIGLAAAPDFTEYLLWDDFGPETRETLLRDGVVHLPSDYGDEPYPITRALIEDGRSHLLLPDVIALACPVRLIQGMKDADVPWRTALRLAERLASDDVEVTLVKDGDHRLSEPADLNRLCRTVAALCEQLA
ncbi:MAG: alpha/beta fold hydrolase [Alphaproteobacteria bacterium]